MTLRDIRVTLKNLLLSDNSIRTSVSGRVFPNILPQGVVDPSIVFHRISGLGIGAMNGDTGLSRPRMQIDAWAKTHDQAASLADQVKEKISGFRGNVGSVMIQGIFYESERDSFDSVAKLHCVTRDYFIWFEER